MDKALSDNTPGVRCFGIINPAEAILPMRPARALIGDALDDPEPGASRQTPAAGQHAEPRSKACVCGLRQSGLPPQRGIGREQFSRRHDLWRSATPHALHRVRSSRRRRWPLMAASWLIGRRRSRTPLVHSHVGLLQPIYKRFPLGSDLCDKRCSDAFVELQQLVDRH
jgi:hypothetical protein